MFGKKLVCLIYGPDSHYIDHLAPLSSLLKIPLVVTDLEIEESLRKHYPNIDLIWEDNRKIHPYIVKNFEGVISCFSRRHYEAYFSLTEKLLNKQLSYIWCPHGNSDKENLAAIREEKHILIYGDQMKDRIAKTNSKCCVLGNFRMQYYQHNRAFYDHLVQKEVFQNFPQKQNTFLYAPTWEDYEKNSSFERIFPLLKFFPDHFNLIVQFHPNTWIQHEFTIERLIGKYENENIQFLRNFFPIYPLLNCIDGYIGDVSSIGYDFLFFDKPLLFLTDRKNLRLFTCGQKIAFNDIEELPKILKTAINNNSKYSDYRRKLREYTFDLKLQNVQLEFG